MISAAFATTKSRSIGSGYRACSMGHPSREIFHNLRKSNEQQGDFQLAPPSVRRVKPCKQRSELGGRDEGCARSGPGRIFRRFRHPSAPLRRQADSIKWTAGFRRMATEHG